MSENTDDDFQNNYRTDFNLTLNISLKNESTDYSDNLKIFKWGELIPVLLIYSFTYIIGVIGNLLIIYTVLKFKRLRSTTNIFLLSLASADLLLVSVCIPVKLTRLFTFTWTLGLVICKSVYYIQTVSAFCSVLTLVTISIERYYAILYPLKAQYNCTISKARKISLLIWFLSFILALPVLAVQVQLEVSHKGVVVSHWCVKNFDSEVLWPLYETYIFVTILVLPVVIMGGAYVAICRAVFSMVENRREMSNRSSIGNNTNKENNEIEQVVTMLVIVVSLFIVCWAPVLVLNLLKSYRVIRPYSIALKHVTTAADLLSYINSCLNPLIYGFLSRHFRESFLTAMKCNTKSTTPNFKTAAQFSTRMSTVKMHNSSIRFDPKKTYIQRVDNSGLERIESTAV